MSRDILKPINIIKTSINESDQILWECQASTKCYTQVAEKLKEECQRINKEIVKADEELHELGPQIEILSSCYKVQSENIILNQHSLVNLRLHRKCISASIKKHQEDANRTIDKYSEHIQKCKGKLELTNSTYKTFLTTKTDLKKRKIHCLDLKKKISKLNNFYKQKVNVRQKRFNGDIITFVQVWLSRRKYSETEKQLTEEKQKERQYMQKLMEVTELLRQKQKGYCRKEVSFKIPRIEFPKNDPPNSVELLPGKVKNKLNHFSDIQTLLEKNSLASPTKNNNQGTENHIHLQKHEYNANNSKIRILENKTLRQFQEVEKSLPSKEERSKSITEKLQRVVHNFNKRISRHNSKQQVEAALHKSFGNDSKLDNFNKKSSQQINLSQEDNATKMDIDQSSQNVEYNGCGASQELQNLNINSQGNNSQSHASNHQFNNDFVQFPKNQFQGFSNSCPNQRREFSTKTGLPGFPSKPQKDIATKRFSQETKRPSKIPSNIPTDKATDKATVKGTDNIQQSSGISNQTFGNNFFGGKSPFSSTPGFGDIFSIYSSDVKGNKTTQENSPFKKPENVGLAEKSHFITNFKQTKTTKEPANISQGRNVPVNKPENNVAMQNNQPELNDSGNNGNKNLLTDEADNGANRPTENSREHGNYMQIGAVSSYNFGNDTQFSQILNESYDYEGGSFTSPQFDQSLVASPPGNENMNTSMNFGDSMFSFGQTNKPFKFLP